MSEREKVLLEALKGLLHRIDYHCQVSGHENCIKQRRAAREAIASATQRGQGERDPKDSKQDVGPGPTPKAPKVEPTNSETEAQSISVSLSPGYQAMERDHRAMEKLRSFGWLWSADFALEPLAGGYNCTILGDALLKEGDSTYADPADAILAQEKDDA